MAHHEFGVGSAVHTKVVMNEIILLKYKYIWSYIGVPDSHISDISAIISHST